MAGSNKPLGKGRVMSQISMQAVRLPSASSASGRDPVGETSAWATHARASANTTVKHHIRCRLGHARAGVGQHRHGRLADDGDIPVIRQLKGELSFAVIEGDMHIVLGPGHGP